MKSTEALPDTGTEEGFALLAVLGFLLLLSAVLLPFASSARIRALTAGNRYDDVRFDDAAAAVNAIVATRLAANSGQASSLDTLQSRCKVGRALLDIRVQPHSGLIDLNVADDKLLTFGLTAAGLSENAAMELASVITQYRRLDADRSVDVVASLIGAEGMKYGPFEDITELFDFIPLRAVPLQTLADIFTVNTKSAAVSEATSSPRLKEALQSYSDIPEGLSRIEGERASIYTIKTTIRDASKKYSVAGIYDISDRRVVRLINRQPSDGADEQAGSGPGNSSCSAIFDGKTIELFEGVF